MHNYYAIKFNVSEYSVKQAYNTNFSSIMIPPKGLES